MLASQVKEIIKEERLFAYAFEHAAIGMALVAPNGKWLMVNQALCRLFGYEENELLSLSFQDITHPSDIASDLHDIDDLLHGKRSSYQKEKRYIHKEGQTLHALLSCSLVKNESGAAHFLISQIQDITERKLLEQELAKQAQEDPLTGLCNRRCFLQVSSREITRMSRYEEPSVLLMVDIDHFKKVNDTYGHVVGDEALKVMADTCSQILRPFDIFGRIGGEEFSVLLVKANLATGLQVAERLRSAVEKIRLETDIGTLQFTISIGGTAFLGDNHSLQQLMQQADTALYQAKSSGRNRVIITEDSSYRVIDGVEAEHGFIHLQWQEDYQCGNDIIDRQHRELFKNANTLLSQMSSAKNEEIDTGLVEQLIAEVVHHFKTEEAVLRSMGYPDVLQHGEIHQQLVNKARMFKEKLTVHQIGMADVLHFLAIDVVHDHLLLEDRKFYPIFTPESVSQQPSAEDKN